MTATFPEQPEQEVFAADVVVPERARLVLRQDDDLSGTLCEPSEDRTSLAAVLRRGGRALLASAEKAVR